MEPMDEYRDEVVIPCPAVTNLVNEAVVPSIVLSNVAPTRTYNTPCVVPPTICPPLGPIRTFPLKAALLNTANEIPCPREVPAGIFASGYVTPPSDPTANRVVTSMVEVVIPAANLATPAWSVVPSKVAPEATSKTPTTSSLPPTVAPPFTCSVEPNVEPRDEYRNDVVIPAVDVTSPLKVELPLT